MKKTAANAAKKAPVAINVSKILGSDITKLIGNEYTIIKELLTPNTEYTVKLDKPDFNQDKKRFNWEIFLPDGHKAEIHTTAIINEQGAVAPMFSKTAMELYIALGFGNKPRTINQVVTDIFSTFLDKEVIIFLEPRSGKDDAGQVITWNLLHFGKMPEWYLKKLNEASDKADALDAAIEKLTSAKNKLKNK